MAAESHPAANREWSVPPAAITLGARDRSADPGSGVARLTFDAPANLANIMGYVQGGFVAGMLDSSMGLAMRSVLPDGVTAPTMEMKISYLRPAPIGRLIGLGRVIHVGGSVAFLDGELQDDQGQVLAIATSTVKLQKGHQPAKDTRQE